MVKWRERGEKIVSLLWGLPGNIHFWWTVGLPSLPTVGVALVVYIQSTPIWAAILLILFVYCLALGGSLFARQKWWSGSQGHATYTGRQLDDEDLRQRCRELSVELFEFYNQQQEDLDKRLRWTVLATGPERSRIRSEATVRHDKQTMNRYGEQFGSRVLNLADHLTQHGCIAPRDQERFEHPAKPQDIQYIAQPLEAICGKSGRG